MKSDKLHGDFGPLSTSHKKNERAKIPFGMRGASRNLINVEIEIYCLRMQFDG